MKNILAGIQHFQKHVFPSKEKMFQGLAKGQRPEVLLITCSDSRIDAELITNSGPGEIFHIRNAGNLVPRYHEHLGAEAASIEFGVSVLGIRNIIVCGHSDCGAMKGLMNPDSLTTLPAVAAWVKHGESALASLEDGNRNLDSLIRANILQQIDNLKTHPAVATRLDEISLFAWLYQIDAGSVLNYDSAGGRFVPVQEVFAAMHNAASTTSAA
jgi:carbonic anhydrase